LNGLSNHPVESSEPTHRFFPDHGELARHGINAFTGGTSGTLVMENQLWGSHIFSGKHQVLGSENTRKIPMDFLIIPEFIASQNGFFLSIFRQTCD
jgi:hypothetical protein